MISYRLHPQAQKEFEEAVAYYDEISIELGDSFVDEVEHAIVRVLTFPDAWQSLSVNIRRCRVNRFPYGLVYYAESEGILIVALMQLQRKPDYWKERL